MKETLKIGGMSCANCAKRIERQVAQVEGVALASVNFASNTLFVEYPEKSVKQAIVDTVAHMGYEVIQEQEEAVVVSHMRSRVLWTLVFAIPLVYLAMGHMFHIPMPGVFHNPLVMALTQAMLSIPIVWINRQYYVKGFKQLQQRDPGMDALVAVGTAAAFLQGIVAIYLMLVGQPSDIYFESGAVILTLVTVGKYIEEKAKHQTSDAIQKLVNRTPKMATVIEQGVERVLPVEHVQVGATVVSRSGEYIALDGVVTKGQGQIDQSMITGESMPVTKREGDKVVGGSLNTNGVVYYTVTHVGEDTVLSQIRQLIEQAQGSQVPLARLADKISRYFVPTVMALAVLSGVIWTVFGQVNLAWQTMIATLVIACPCALGLATPTAIMVATGKAAQKGLLIKNGEALETSNQVDVVLLDKTGTITKGQPIVSDVLTQTMTKQDVLYWASGVEVLSTHPLAKAVMHAAKEQGVADVTGEQFQILDGLGVYARVQEKDVYIGNETLMAQYGSPFKEYERVQLLQREQHTVVYVIVDGETIGALAIVDAIKETSKQAIAELQSKGIEVVMVTGDHPETAHVIAEKVGIKTVHAGLLPKDKAEIVVALQQKGKTVAMVGDGINDAPALVQANVGIAIGHGMDVAIDSADIIVMNSELEDIVRMITLSEQTVQTIKENLFFAFVYNVIGIPIAMGALYPALGLLLNPMLAGLAMSFSSISVVLNALRLKYFK